MSKSGPLVEVAFRGDAGSLADEFSMGLRDTIGMGNPKAAQDVGRAKGAGLGIGIVLITFVASEVGKELIKRGVEWVWKKIEEKWKQPETAPAVKIEIQIRSGADYGPSCQIEPIDTSSTIREKLAKWQEALEAEKLV